MCLYLLTVAQPEEGPRRDSAGRKSEFLITDRLFALQSQPSWRSKNNVEIDEQRAFGTRK